ncbi:hypothetical protein ACKTEK_09210 [Tepidamorphus sp. 3E244]|uniref:hypothetical protein n=1 Tax=Tepidamorphus sp. 3E244 TaxID=3385498 RepID=UPI0038FD226F
MDIKLRCIPGYKGLIPEPVIGIKALPDWFRAMPNKAESETLGRESVPTFKQCPPFLDAVRTGIVFPLATDVRFKDGEMSWDWDLPKVPGVRATQSPIGLHVPEQWHGAPLRADKGHFAVKFSNFWTVETPPGISLYFGHPFNREDLPFRSLSGIVDTDHFTRGFIHFPAIWIDPDFEGTLPAGTPVAQAVPIRREELTLDVGELDEAGVAEQIEFQEGLSADTQLYRRKYRQDRAGG